MRKISIGGWQLKLEHMQRDYLIQERGGMCELCRKSPAVVADHCFSRMVRALFFDRRNLTVLCSSCHFKKTHRIKGADLQVYELVKNREGEKTFNELCGIAMSHKTFPEFSKRWYLQEVQDELEKLNRSEIVSLNHWPK